MGYRRKEREAFWRGVVQRQAESGMNVASFCRQESISAPSFYAWRRKLKERDAEAPQANGQSDNGDHRGAQLLPVHIETSVSSGPVRILMPHGVSLEAPGGMDRRALIEVLGALRESQVC